MGLILEIEDDGGGLGPNQGTTGGMGLNIMAYRASILGGTLAVEQAPGGGTRIVWRAPGGGDGNKRVMGLHPDAPLSGRTLKELRTPGLD